MSSTRSGCGPDGRRSPGQGDMVGSQNSRFNPIALCVSDLVFGAVPREMLRRQLSVVAPTKVGAHKHRCCQAEWLSPPRPQVDFSSLWIPAFAGRTSKERAALLLAAYGLSPARCRADCGSNRGTAADRGDCIKSSFRHRSAGASPRRPPADEASNGGAAAPISRPAGPGCRRRQRRHRQTLWAHRCRGREKRPGRGLTHREPGDHEPGPGPEHP